jgi:EAL domain-containing protein (putative c-di-GMP-specific phosphodiesterase class I)
MSKAVSDRGLSFAVQKVSQIDALERALYWECFARMTDAAGVVHDAASFAPYLESSDGSFDLDVNMLALILADLAADENLILGCNLSAANLATSDRWRRIEEQITRRPELAARLILEITETYPLSGEGIRRLASVRSLGCRLAIDNFGAGFGTPKRLFALDADIVKIDASLVQDVRMSKTGHHSLYHLVGFAACVAPIVVAEGIEKQEQLDVARAAGATHAQGFHLGRPNRLADALASSSRTGR